MPRAARRRNPGVGDGEPPREAVVVAGRGGGAIAAAAAAKDEEQEQARGEHGEEERRPDELPGEAPWRRRPERVDAAAAVLGAAIAVRQ